MTQDQLFNAYMNNEIGSQLEKDIMSNPLLVAAKEQYNKQVITD
jgi:hypothetical protein